MVTCRSVLAESGRIVFFSVVEDITAQRQQKIALKVAQENLEQVRIKSNSKRNLPH